MITHLRSEYGTLTPEELETNRAALSEPWNLDDPIEDLWSKISNIQRVAAFGNVPIPDITIITLTLAMIEKTGLLASTTEKFRLRPIDEWTVPLFKLFEFQLGNKERLRRLTAGDAGISWCTLRSQHTSAYNRHCRGCRNAHRTSATSCCPPCHSGRRQNVLLLDTRSQSSAQPHVHHMSSQSRGPSRSMPLPSVCAAATTKSPLAAPAASHPQPTDASGSLPP
jgi:hypothetical protein